MLLGSKRRYLDLRKELEIKKDEREHSEAGCKTEVQENRINELGCELYGVGEIRDQDRIVRELISRKAFQRDYGLLGGVSAFVGRGLAERLRYAFGCAGRASQRGKI